MCIIIVYYIYICLFIYLFVDTYIHIHVFACAHAQIMEQSFDVLLLHPAERIPGGWTGSQLEPVLGRDFQLFGGNLGEAQNGCLAAGSSSDYRPRFFRERSIAIPEAFENCNYGKIVLFAGRLKYTFWPWFLIPPGLESWRCQRLKLCVAATGEEVEYLQLQRRLHWFFVNTCAFGWSGSRRVGTPMYILWSLAVVA